MAQNRDRQVQRRRLLKLAAVLVAVLGWALLRAQLAEPLGLDGARAQQRADAFRVISWNLANFRGDPDEHDLERMAEILGELDPDVIAVQEVKDPAALAKLLPAFELRLSEAGGRGGQHLGIAYHRERVELLAASEHPELSLDGRVRPALSAYVRGREGGPDLWLLVVHLKAMSRGIEERREQWPMLAAIAERLPAATPDAAPDRDLLVLGDFNTTGCADGKGPAGEQAELATVLAPAGLRRLPNATGCSAYYEGGRRDAWKEPSEIDLIWVRGLEGWLAPEPQVFSGTMCAALACTQARSTEPYPLRDYAFVSDHCPLILDLDRP